MHPALSNVVVRSMNVNAISDESRSSRASTARDSASGDWRLEALIDRLPQRVGGAVSYLLQPKSRWVRIPAGVLLIGGGLLAFLPVLGVWMLPVGLALLAEDVPAFRSTRSKVLDWIERRRPQWLSSSSRPNNPS
jgi:hypothetical protein